MSKQKRLYSVCELLDLIPVSRASLYAAIKRGEIPSANVGRRIFVPEWAIEKLLNPPAQGN